MAIAASFPNLRPSLLLDFANAKAVDPRITFTRSTTAKYYDGVTTAKAEENLLTYSQEFDNAAWVPDGSTVTANTITAPDGTTTSDTIKESSANSQHIVRAAVPTDVGRVYTISAFAKPNGRDFLHLSYNASSANFFAHATFDVNTGVVTQSGAVGYTLGSASITAAANGFYRCVLSFTVVTQTGASPCFGISDTGTPSLSSTGRAVYTGDGTSGLYIWGAQLEARSQATAYTPTTTQPITNYIPVLQTAAAGVPRIDHDPVTGECLGLLIEEQRTNLFLRSEEFDNASRWATSSVTISANSIVAPDGTLTADKLVEDTSSAIHRITTNFTTSVTSGTTYTAGVFAKAGGRRYLRINFNTLFAANVLFDLQTGTVTNTVSGTGAITSIGNGWFRCSITGTAGTTQTSTGFIELQATAAGASETYTGDGYSGIFIWGAQLESGAFPTSYIPTVATQETRNADAASMTGTNFSSWFNNGEGTLYGDYKAAAPNRYVFAIRGAAYTTDQILLQTSGAYTNPDGSLSSTALVAKRAISYEINNLSMSTNGGAAASDTSVTNGWSGAATTVFGSSTITGGSSINGTIKKIAYYPQALTAANLQALTA